MYSYKNIYICLIRAKHLTMKTCLRSLTNILSDIKNDRMGEACIYFMKIILANEYFWMLMVLHKHNG